MLHAYLALATFVAVGCTTTASKIMIEPFVAEGAPAAIGPYSHGVECSGSLTFLSGQIALRPDGTMLEGDVAAQTELALANVRTLLAARGLSLHHVVKTTVFLADMNDFAAMNDVYARTFGNHRPARSAVEVSRLPKDARVEIEVIACR
jgi:2-iminobutanoate/2-iminopropanoate deaminase